MKRSLIIIASLTAVIALTGFVYAGPYGYGGGKGMRGGGPGYYQQLSPEERAKRDKEKAEFLNATLEQRKALAVKMVELKTLNAQTKPDQAKIKALAKEVVDLRTEIAKKRIDILGDSAQGRGYGRGYGRGKRGPGGPGMMGGYGGGYGACWR